ncbi:GntR family transcriptional regulator, partial [Promicromonospora citrea]
MPSDQTNSSPAAEVLVALAPGPGTLRHRLEDALLEAVASGRLAPGTALPPSRTLAESLGISRWVVTETYGHLVGKGVLEARTGSATRVAATADGGTADGSVGSERRERTTVRSAADGGPHEPAPERAPSRATYDLAPGVPDLRHVPREAWARAVREALAVAA